MGAQGWHTTKDSFLLLDRSNWSYRLVLQLELALMVVREGYTSVVSSKIEALDGNMCTIYLKILLECRF